MSALSRRKFVFGSALVAAAALGAVARPPRGTPPANLQRDLETGLPAVVGAYSQARADGIVLPPQDELSKAIYDGYVTRAYAAAGLAPIYLVVAYGAVQDYALQLHRPEVCYPASGYSIGPISEQQLKLGPTSVTASAMRASLGQRSDSVLWWTRIGTSFPVTAWQERREILAQAVHRRSVDGILVRLSTADQAGAPALLTRFAGDLVRATSAATKALLLGPQGMRA